MAEGSLSDIRVIDCSSGLAEATGRCLADLGAEVLKIEPPHGCEGRHRAPFAESGGESLFWKVFGLGKRSVVLDVFAEGGRVQLNRLLATADVLIESFPPTELTALGLEATSVATDHPHLVHVSVTPFGGTGPLAGAPASDMTLSAAGGLLNHQGDKDRQPIPIGYSESANHGAVSAVADAIIALYERDQSGRGQHLDTSMQAAVVGTLLWTSSFAAIDRNPAHTGDDRSESATDQGGFLAPGIPNPVVEPCADGWVVMTYAFGSQGANAFHATMKWAEEEGALDPDLCGRGWVNWIEEMKDGRLSAEDGIRAMHSLLEFIKTKTKTEIHSRSVSHKLFIAPCNNAADLLEDPQLRARDFWVDVDGLEMPGPFAVLSRTPIEYSRPAPELGADQDLLDSLVPPTRPTVPATPRRPAFEGLKVADMTWMAAGPLMTRELANHGATVVHIETSVQVDSMRYVPPHEGSRANLDNSLPAANVNQSKLGLACNLQAPESRDVVDRLIRWADIVVENFRPGMAASNGFGWERVHEVNPRAVMLSTSMRGQTGPESTFTGFGLQGAAMAGFVDVTGWPDRSPIAPWGAYTDFISPRYGISALVAALRERERTGEGQLIDLSQNETGVHFLAPLVLDHQVNGTTYLRPGDRPEQGAPSGVFPSAGTSRFVAVSAITDREWEGVQSLVPALADAPFDKLDRAGRLTGRDEIHSVFADWLRGEEPFEAAERMRAAGVPAYVSMRATDLIRDPQLSSRGFFTPLEHRAIGNGRFDGPVTIFSETPNRPTRAGPTIGEHTEFVLGDLLGFTDDEITRLALAQVLS